jgi:uncharacterized delta-60 repeat protein
MVAIATGLICPAALGDPGDLDPTFADVGRFVGPEDFDGNARGVAPQDDDFVFAGGELVTYYYYYAEYTHGFAGRVLVDGTLDTGFDAPGLDDTFVVDAAVQPDGKLVGIGVRGDELLVLRLERDGALDTGFGVNGTAVLTGVDALGSVALDAAGNVVVAGRLGADLKVMRLLSNGVMDDAFGAAGVFTAAAESAGEEMWNAPRILVADDGGYRVTDNDAEASVSRCRVLALTADGAIDETFGDHGYAGLAAPSGSIGCLTMVEAPDGGLIVGGYEGSEPMLVRLVASGAVDAAFATDGLANTPVLTAAAIDVDAGNGSIAVAGYGDSAIPGFPVARLAADGSLDTAFGNGGTTWVDLPATGSTSAYLVDVTVLPNSDVLVAGGSSRNYFNHAPFIAKLVGADGVDGPGVIGVVTTSQEAIEGDDAVITVRRVGGKTGAISVAYAVAPNSDGFFSAIEGDDFAATSGRLDWVDGDIADKQIVIPIAAHAGSPEEHESFAIELSDAQGGAGLGMQSAFVDIRSDSPEAGMFAIETTDFGVGEAEGFAQLYVSRGYSYTGAVSVTVTVASDTATAGEDFDGGARTITWADGDADWKLVSVQIIDDTDEEGLEQFTVTLSDPTGGAIVGPRSSTVVAIRANDAPPPPPPSSGGGGGGGQLGIGSLLLLGALRLLRLRR